MRNIFLVCIILCSAAAAYAQQHAPVPAKPKKNPRERFNAYQADTLLQPIPKARILFHDKIDNEQKLADGDDGNTDNKVTYGHNAVQTALLSAALLTDVDRLQVMVEDMPANGHTEVADNQLRIQCLRALWELLRQYNDDPKPSPDHYRRLVDNMHDMLVAINEDKLMDYVQAHADIYSLDNGKVLLNDHPDVRAYIYLQVAAADPVLLLKRLPEYAKDTFAGAIIKAAARIDPKLVLDYALSSDILLKKAVYATEDPLVQAIVQISVNSSAPLKAFPFLSDIYTGRKSIGAVDTLAEDPVRYFQELVRLKLSGEELTRRIYTDELRYRTLRSFVRQMNELHEEPDEIRFKCIDSLPPSALYFIMVYGQEELYTSSFLGTFKRMMERMAPMKSDDLLRSLRYDDFRTFIRMCAGYNTLSDFLAAADDTARASMMARFVGGLQNGREDDLEDAVNVADAFGSIRDTTLTLFLQNKVKENYEQSYAAHDRKGTAIYSLLSMLLESNKVSGSDTGAVSASARLKLPPINKVPFNSLVDDSGVIYQQVFFYGDDDGKIAYDGFIDAFKKDRNWKIATEKYWSVISSVTGRRVVIYANLPLKSPEDEVALDSLEQHLAFSGIHPTIMVHRGHSYHVKTTLSKLDTFARIVVLGSCGGYQNVATVLNHSPDAHIISSKQTGVGAINEPITQALNAQLLAGADVNWITMWHELDDYFMKHKELYEKYTDYVPPYKNLGVIFIKAYRQMIAGK